MDYPALMHDFTRRQEEFTRLVARLAERRSFSGEAANINGLLDEVTELFGRWDPAIQRFASPAGDVLQLDFPGTGPRPVVLLAHADTVQVSEKPLPVRRDERRLFGSGVLDMKQAIALFHFALEVLSRQPADSRPAVRLLVNPDEETGSRHSLPLLLRQCRDARAVLLPEPCGPGGALKTRRKGVMALESVLEGRAAHSGVDPAAGRDANRGLARFLLEVDDRLQAFPGVTFNPGVIQGGREINIVSPQSRLRGELRGFSTRELETAAAKVAGIRQVGDIAVRTDTRLLHPALEETERNGRLVRIARDITAGLGQPLSTCASGGASDGSDLSAAGIPVLDGLGMRGGGAHTTKEFIDLDDFPFRATLITALCLEVPA
jgi:glutamate carboxypeptidase